MVIGRNGNWTMWIVDQLMVDEMILDHVGSGLNGSGRNGNKPIKHHLRSIKIV